MNVLNKNGTAYLITRYRIMLMLGGYELTRDSKILDFGCGAGGTVYAFRDEGFDARGFDIYDYLKLRAPEDRQFFDITATKSDDPSNYTMDWDNFRLPYPDETFDFVCSVSVMEHVQNHDAVLRELHRVTKHNGVQIHEFPPRWELIEGHMFVPLAGVIQWRAWFWLWALLGVRNGFQKGSPASYAVEMNVKYSRTGVRYLPNRTLHEIGRRYFARSEFVPGLHSYASQTHQGIKRRYASPLACWWHSTFRSIVWWLSRH